MLDMLNLTISYLICTLPFMMLTPSLRPLPLSCERVGSCSCRRARTRHLRITSTSPSVPSSHHHLPIPTLLRHHPSSCSSPVSPLCPFMSPPSYSTCTMERGRGVQVHPSTSSTTTPRLTPTCGTSAAAFSETRQVHNTRDCTPCSSLTHLALPVLVVEMRSHPMSGREEQRAMSTTTLTHCVMAYQRWRRDLLGNVRTHSSS